jgi:hypothetical protein
MVLFLGVILCFAHRAHAQDTQIWVDADGHVPLGADWKYKVDPNYRVLAEDEGWTRVGLRNTFSRKHYPWLSPEASLDVYYTADPVSADVEEFRPWLALKFILPKFVHAIHLDKPFFYVRFEERFLWYPEEDTDDQKARLRLKVGGAFLLNSNELTGGTLYAPWYLEGFHNFNGEAFERSSEKDRISIGLGYVFDSAWRGDLVYIAQGAKDTLESGFDKTDNIFQLRVDYNFGK